MTTDTMPRAAQHQTWHSFECLHCGKAVVDIRVDDAHTPDSTTIKFDAPLCPCCKAPMHYNGFWAADEDGY